MLIKSEDAVLPLPICHALPLIGTSEPVKQVDIFREANEELSELGLMGHVFKEEFLARDGDVSANMKIEAENLRHRTFYSDFNTVCLLCLLCWLLLV